MSYTLTLTTAGLDALVDAQNGETDPIRVTEVGFTNQQVTIAPTLTALPGEIKRIDTISGTAVSETIIHMTAQDASEDGYSLRAFGLYLDDGTLFAVYGQATPIATKTPMVQLQIAFDIAFQDGIAGDIEFGDATFLFPPATETIKGVAEIATQQEVTEGTDDQRIVTPLKLASALAAVIAMFVSATEEEEGLIELATQGEVDAGADNTRAVTPLKLAARLAPVIDAINAETQARSAAIAELVSRTITGGGLASGGGSLAANRVISVAAATVAELLAGTSGTSAITPAAFGPIVKSFGQNGYIALALGDPANALCLQWGRFTVGANGTTNVSFPVTFAECWTALTDGTSDSNVNSQDNYPAILPDSITASGFLTWSARDVSEPITFIAIGRVDLS